MVTVCVTTYNHARWVAQALESILAQRTSFEVEVIVGDDCSTDSTVDVCRAYVERYPGRVRLLEAERNMGMRANYRRTIEAARGEYIAMCDGNTAGCVALRRLDDTACEIKRLYVRNSYRGHGIGKVMMEDTDMDFIC